MLEQLPVFFHDINFCNLKYKIQLINGSSSRWDHFLIFPVPLYLECRFGVFKLKDIEYIAIKLIEERDVGRLVSNQQINHSEVVISKLNHLNIPHKVEDGLVVIELK